MSYVNYNGIGTGSMSAAHAEIERGLVFQGGLGNVHEVNITLQCQGLPRISLQVQGTRDGGASTGSTVPYLDAILYGSIQTAAELEGTPTLSLFELARMTIPMGSNGTTHPLAPIYMEFNTSVKFLRLNITLPNAYIASDTNYGKMYARLMASQ